MFEVHISKHSPLRLKITVGCPRCCGVLCVHEGVVLCGVLRGVCVVCCVGVGVGVCCVVWWCVWCGAVKLWHWSLSLALSPSSVSVLFLFFLSYLFSLLSSFSFLFSHSCSFTNSILLLLFFLSLLSSLFFPLFSPLSSLPLFLLCLLFSPPNTMERTVQPTRRPTSRHLNVMWRRASAQQSVLSLLLSPLASLLSLSSSKKEKDTFNYGNISRRVELIYITVV